MGEGLLRYFQIKFKKEHKMAFVLTFLFVLLIHLYKFTNNLPNHDSIYNYYSDQNILGSGRWALSLACGISSYYDLPWIIGLMSCIFIALTAVVITALFKIKNPILIILVGSLIAAAPATTETFYFLYTADGYMIAMFLAALAVYCSRIDENRLSRWIFSGICICVSCGIYQAYVSFALVLAVCYFIDVLLQNNHSKADCFRWVLRQIIIYSASLAAYFAVWKLCMYFGDIAANNYQGISEIGRGSGVLFIKGLVNSIKTTILYFLQWDVLKHGFTLYNVLNLLFILFMAAGLLISCIKSEIIKRKWATLLFVLCLIAIIPFACIWHFISATVEYRAMMLQSLTLLFVLTALLYERWAKLVIKNVVCLLLILVVGNNAIMANIGYFYLDACNKRTYAESIEMISEIHNFQDEYEFDKIAIVGDRSDEARCKVFEPKTMERQIISRIVPLATGLEKTLLFDPNHTIGYLQMVFGLELEVLNCKQRNELLKTDEVRSLDCWPSDNSITVIDDVLVIKLSDRRELEFKGFR